MIDTSAEIRQMKELVGGCPEESHGEADDILCRVLIRLGAEELVEEFGKVSKWYA